MSTMNVYDLGVSSPLWHHLWYQTGILHLGWRYHFCYTALIPTGTALYGIFGMDMVRIFKLGRNHWAYDHRCI